MGGKSGQTTGYWYRVAYHAGLAVGPIDAFLEFRAGDRTAWAGEITDSTTFHIEARNLFGGEKDQGGISSDVDLMFGEATQQPSVYLRTLGQYLEDRGSNGGLLPYLATMAGAQPPADPTGKVPAWRGFTTLAFKGGYFGAMNPYPQRPSYKFRRILKGWDNDTCWYPERAAVPVDQETRFGVYWKVKFIALNDATDYSAPALDDSSWAQGSLPLISNGYIGSQAIADAGFVNQPGTVIPLSTNAWFRGHIQVADPSSPVPVALWVDNGAQIWVNGTKVIDFYSVAGGPGSDAIPASALHAGDNEVAIKYISDGSGESYFGIHIDLPSNLYGMNPAHLLYDSLTCAEMGREPIASIHDASFRAGADWFFGEGIGLCTCYDPSQESTEEFRQRICTVAGCGVNRSPVDGLWYLDVANGVYDLDSLPILTDDDILEFSEQPALKDSAANSISVEYFDPQKKTTVLTPPVQALALADSFGTIHQDTQYHEVPTGDLATRLAQRDLQSSVTPTRGFELTTTRKPYSWRRGIYFRLQTPKRGIADMVCLLGDVSSGTLKSGAIKLTAVQNIYSLPQVSFVQGEPGVDTRPSQIAIAIANQAVFEAPYFELVRNLSRADLDVLPDDAGYLMTVAADPSASRDYSMMVSTDGGNTYAAVGTAHWCPTAEIVEGDPLTGDAPATVFTLANGSLLDSVQVGSAALWEGVDRNHDEICRVDAIDLVADTVTLGRGCADTLPQLHAANSRIWFFDGYAGADSTEYTDGETLDVELLTNTGSAQLDPALATAMAVTFAGRQALPYPPAGLTLNGTAWHAVTSIDGALALAWKYRDRTSQADQLIDETAASVGPEDGVRYAVECYETDGTLITSRNDIGDDASSVVLNYTGVVRFVIYALSDVGTSLQKYDFTIAYAPPAGTDASSIGGAVYEPDEIIINGGGAP